MSLPRVRCSRSSRPDHCRFLGHAAKSSRCCPSPAFAKSRCNTTWARAARTQDLNSWTANDRSRSAIPSTGQRPSRPCCGSSTHVMRISRRRAAAPWPTTFPNSARPTPIISASASQPWTATSTRSATPLSPSPSSRCRNPLSLHSRWIRWVLRASKARSGSSHQAIPSTPFASTPTTIPSIPWSMPARSPAPG